MYGKSDQMYVGAMVGWSRGLHEDPHWFTKTPEVVPIWLVAILQYLKQVVVVIHVGLCYY